MYGFKKVNKFETKGLLENYLGGWFDADSFYNNFTRKELRNMLVMLYPFQAKENPRAFSNMCKNRMIKHIEFYMNIHVMNKHPREFWQGAYYFLEGELKHPDDDIERNILRVTEKMLNIPVSYAFL